MLVDLDLKARAGSTEVQSDVRDEFWLEGSMDMDTTDMDSMKSTLRGAEHRVMVCDKVYVGWWAMELWLCHLTKSSSILIRTHGSDPSKNEMIHDTCIFP